MYWPECFCSMHSVVIVAKLLDGRVVVVMTVVELSVGDQCNSPKGLDKISQ